MKQQPTNSRRNFLSTLAILGSGTVLAGSPLNVWAKNSSASSLEANWALLVKNYGATGFLKLAASVSQQVLQPVMGQLNKACDIVHFGKENLLAQPTWIYWANNGNQPSDVVITFYEASHPYKKLQSINRFELQALVQMPIDKNPLPAICKKGVAAAKNRLQVKTKIGRKKAVQDVQLFENKNIVFNQQFFYNI
jgi:hypothetical protein